MILPYELVAKAAIPALRAIIARKLVEEHGFTQAETARSLEITQAAVSHYMRRQRGEALRLEEVEEIGEETSKIAAIFAAGNADRQVVAAKITALCDRIRGSRLLCELHKHLEADANLENCNVCTSNLNLAALLEGGFKSESSRRPKKAEW